MPGWKNWNAGELVTEPDFQALLQDQTVVAFASAAARTATGWSPHKGAQSYLQDVGRAEVFDGSAWVPLALASGAKVSSFTNGGAKFGTYDPKKALSLIAGTVVGTTDTSGQLAAVFPRPVTCVLTAVATAGDSSNQPANVIVLSASASQVVLKIFDAAWTILVSKAVRMEVIAICQE